jgi:hypothetical protein
MASRPGPEDVSASADHKRCGSSSLLGLSSIGVCVLGRYSSLIRPRQWVATRLAALSAAVHPLMSCYEPPTAVSCGY